MLLAHFSALNGFASSHHLIETSLQVIFSFFFFPFNLDSSAASHSIDHFLFLNYNPILRHFGQDSAGFLTATAQFAPVSVHPSAIPDGTYGPFLPSSLVPSP